MIIYNQEQLEETQQFSNGVYNKEILVFRNKYEALRYRLREEIDKQYKYCFDHNIGRYLYFKPDDGSFAYTDDNIEDLPGCSDAIVYDRIESPCAATISDEKWQRILELVLIYYSNTRAKIWN